MSRELIMELTREQEGGRESQVQPPLNVWLYYFEINFDSLPTLVLQNRKQDSGVEHRPVVEHDHNWTVEIEDAGLPRPAILRMRRVAQNSYDYWVYRLGDAEYEHVNWLLDTVQNPLIARLEGTG